MYVYNMCSSNAPAYKINKMIKGIYVNGLKDIITIITQFADNTTLILGGIKEPLVAVLNMLQIFGSISGLKLNIDKMKLIWLGKKSHSKDQINTTCNLI